MKKENSKRKKVIFYLVDVFTKKNFQGNQLAVIPSADGLAKNQMQKIASEFNFSESVFILKSKKKSCFSKLRIFTPKEEIPFAGHPTIGAIFILAKRNDFAGKQKIQLKIEEQIGEINAFIYFNKNIVKKIEIISPKLPIIGPKAPTLEKISKTISLKPHEIENKKSIPLQVSCGLPFTFIQIKNLKSLRRAKIVLYEWEKNFSSLWAPSLFLYCEETETGQCDFHTRMFGPKLGITEDPATGSAVLAFSAVYNRFFQKNTRKKTLKIEQGIEMNRPSILKLKYEIEKSQISKVVLGGQTQMVGKGIIYL